ncbi:MAG TPA: SIS domain-containing protein, partial [Euryarchaeota archaeon]|nr:SIS domain-containing protein [Euryarchaeota archaeon]
RIMLMHDEIMEEPEVIMKTYRSVWQSIPRIRHEMENSRLIFITGDGSSFHASLYLEHILMDNSLNARAFPATEYDHYFKNSDKNDLAIIFSQSGENVDVLNAARAWKEKGKRLISIVNNEGSSLEEISDISVFLRAGKEMAIPATKTYVSMLIFSYSLHLSLNGIEGDERISLISQRVKEIIKNERILEEISERINERIFILASGLDYVTALEGSLKLMETAGVISMPFYMGEVFHGPIEIIDENSTVFVIENDRIKGSIEKLLKYTKPLIIGDGIKSDILIQCKFKEAGPILNVVPFQLISYFLALRRGRDPDRPPRLKKVVTHG